MVELLSEGDAVKEEEADGLLEQRAATTTTKMIGQRIRILQVVCMK